MQTMIQIPDQLQPDVEHYKDRLGELFMLGLQQIKIQEALFLYQRGVVTIERAAEIAQTTRQSMIQHALAIGIQPRWDKALLEEEKTDYPYPY